MAGRLVEAVKTALDAQTVVVPGTTAAATVLPHLARSLRSLHDQRDQVAAQVEEILDAHPLARVLISMPGLGIRTSARILLEIGDIAAFATSGHLAAYAGLAPVTRRSGSSIKGEHPPTQRRQQSPQTRHVPGRVRLPLRPPEQGLLRPQESQR
ncbi:transposase [Actinomadura meridiana]